MSTAAHPGACCPPESPVDTLIIGAGSAGCVLAARLSEDPNHRVLLVEAGPDYPDPAALPDDLADGRWNSMKRHDWGYRHRPHPRQTVFPFPRGRVVGGSSAVNTCIALRPHPSDFDGWAARGLAGWAWAECLPYFKRLEHDLDFFAEEHHGDAGPLPIRRDPPERLAAWQAAFLEVCEHLGLPRAADANAPGATGAAPHPVNRTIEGRRVSAAEAWLTPAVRARRNLTVVAGALVARLHVHGRNVTGAEVLDPTAGATTVHAARTVLCAGAINTPGVLLRSGIGPRADVERLGVDLVHDLPAVGARLLDHPGAAVFFLPRFGRAHPRAPLIQVGMRYASGAAGTGPADMQLQPGSAFRLPRISMPLFSIMCAVNEANLVGRLRFTSADPRAKPRIELPILADDLDRRRAVDALRLGLRLADTPPMRRLARPLWPSPKALGDDDRAADALARACDSGYHPCGTAPMGAPDDPDAACDPDGRVRGVDGLYIADASLLPTCPTANIHLTVLMVAEKIAAGLKTAPDTTVAAG